MIAHALLFLLGESAPAIASSAPPLWRVLAGAGFIVVWLAAAAVWAAMSLMGGLMANDAGRMTPERHAALLRKLMLGEGLTALAGVAGGLAFFAGDHRTLLCRAFGIALVAGIALQAWVMARFFSAKP